MFNARPESESEDELEHGIDADGRAVAIPRITLEDFVPQREWQYPRNARRASAVQARQSLNRAPDTSPELERDLSQLTGSNLAALFSGFTLLEGMPIMDAASSDGELEVDPALEVSSEPECPNAPRDPSMPE